MFLRENDDLCIHPFFNDNTISHTQREDEEKKLRYVPAALIMEEYMEYLESVKKGQGETTRTSMSHQLIIKTRNTLIYYFTRRII